MYFALRGLVLLSAPLTLGAFAGGSPPDPAAYSSLGYAKAGAALFSGATRFTNGGPPCGACHEVAGMEFPGGGTLGPDLSSAYAKLGPDGTAVALATLYFPTMSPIFADRLLSPAEQSDIGALLAQTSNAGAPAQRRTGWLVLLAAAAFVMFVLMAFVAERRRLRPVRARLVDAARREGAVGR
jgi:hypothetical protein